MADPWAKFKDAEPDPYAEFDDAPAPKTVPPKRKRGVVENVTGFMANVNRGLGVGDELAAGAQTVTNLMTGKTRWEKGDAGSMARAVGNDFKVSMTRQRGAEDGYQADHPRMAALARGTGNALTMAAPAGPGAQVFATGSRAVNAVRGATVAGMTGAAYSAVDRGSLPERAAAAAKTARDPLTLALGAGAGAMVGRAKPKEAPAPTLDELTDLKDAKYAEVAASGHRFNPEDFNDLAVTMAAKMDEEGFHAGLHGKAAVMMDKIGAATQARGGYSPTINELDQLRQQIGRDVASSADKGERRMGVIMREQIDEFIAKHSADNPALLAARDLNSRVEKIRSLDNLDEAATDRAGATGAGGNINNATRQNVIRFQNQTGNLTPEEQALARRTIRGGAAGNTLRAVGGFSPEGGTVRAGLSLATGAMSGGAIPAVGFFAKRASDAITARNVKALRDLIARGGREGAKEVDRLLISAGADDLRSQLANDLAVAAGVQGASHRGATVSIEFPNHPEYGVHTSSR